MSIIMELKILKGPWVGWTSLSIQCVPNTIHFQIELSFQEVMPVKAIVRGVQLQQLLFSGGEFW